MLAADELALWERYQRTGDKRELMDFYVPFVKHMAVNAAHRLSVVTPEDLLAPGMMGAADASGRFDVSMGLQFTTFAARRIWGAMLDEIRKYDWVPRLVRSKARKLAVAESYLTNELGRPPTSDELAAKLELTLDGLDELMRDGTPVGTQSLNREVRQTDQGLSVNRAHLFADKRATRCDERQRSLDSLRTLCKGLDKHDRLIVILYYWERLTMQEIGKCLGCSESRISQRHKDILRRMRERLDADWELITA